MCINSTAPGELPRGHCPHWDPTLNSSSIMFKLIELEKLCLILEKVQTRTYSCRGTTCNYRGSFALKLLIVKSILTDIKLFCI